MELEKFIRGLGSNNIIYPTSSDSTLPPHFTTERGVLLPGHDYAHSVMEQEEYINVDRRPFRGIRHLCLGIYSSIRNPTYGVSPSDALYARGSCRSTLGEVGTSSDKLADIAVLIIKDHFPSGLPVSIGYLPPWVDAALRRDELEEWPEPLPRESDKDSALVKLRGIFEALPYFNLTLDVLAREWCEIEKAVDVILNTVAIEHFTTIEDPRLQMQIGLIKKWLRGRREEFLRVVDEMGWLFEKSRDELNHMHPSRDYSDGLRQRRVAQRSS